DRVVHSKAFRRLKHKTQVFVAPEGDHYRTRLTHTLEATQISRTVARALRLNEDLAEAIGLGHDVGHPPFGHIGEDVLDRCGRERFGRAFRHNEHSLRVVDVLEDLNLTDPVRDGVEHSEQAGDIVQGDEVGGAMLRLRAFMFQNVYLGETARQQHARIERVLRGLFDWFCEHPEELPELHPAASPADRVIDYV